MACMSTSLKPLYNKGLVHGRELLLIYPDYLYLSETSRKLNLWFISNGDNLKTCFLENGKVVKIFYKVFFVLDFAIFACIEHYFSVTH